MNATTCATCSGRWGLFVPFCNAKAARSTRALQQSTHLQNHVPVLHQIAPPKSLRRHLPRDHNCTSFRSAGPGAKIRSGKPFKLKRCNIFSVSGHFRASGTLLNFQGWLAITCLGRARKFQARLGTVPNCFRYRWRRRFFVSLGVAHRFFLLGAAHPFSRGALILVTVGTFAMQRSCDSPKTITVTWMMTTTRPILVTVDIFDTQKRCQKTRKR